MKFLNVLFFILFIMQALNSQKATVREENLNMKTYMFGDPDPVANINRIYPYFRFDGYTDQGEYRDWKMVVLENDYIKVYVSPEVGGKIWGAIEKSTGKEFMYFTRSLMHISAHCPPFYYGQSASKKKSWTQAVFEKENGLSPLWFSPGSFFFFFFFQ